MHVCAQTRVEVAWALPLGYTYVFNKSPPLYDTMAVYSTTLYRAILYTEKVFPILSIQYTPS